MTFKRTLNFSVICTRSLWFSVICTHFCSQSGILSLSLSFQSFPSVLSVTAFPFSFLGMPNRIFPMRATDTALVVAASAVLIYGVNKTLNKLISFLDRTFDSADFYTPPPALTALWGLSEPDVISASSSLWLVDKKVGGVGSRCCKNRQQNFRRLFCRWTAGTRWQKRKVWNVGSQ